MSTAATEQRRAGRLTCQRLTCELGEVLDVSASGVRIATRSWSGLRPGDSTQLTLRTNNGAVMVEAMVMWARKVGLRKRQVGLRFINIDERTRRQLWAMASAGAPKGDGRPTTPVTGRGEWADTVSAVNSV